MEFAATELFGVDKHYSDFVKPDIGEAHWSGQSYKRLIVAAGIREAGKSSSEILQVLSDHRPANSCCAC